MPINNRQNYSFLQDYNNLDVALQIWGEGYLGKEDFLHVAIARKAPRLLEWVCQNGVDSNGILSLLSLLCHFWIGTKSIRFWLQMKQSIMAQLLKKCWL